MTSWIVITSCLAVLLAGEWVIKKMDVFMARHVLHCTGTKNTGEADSHEQPKPADAG